MKIDKIDYELARETVYSYEHESGLKAFVIPKKGYSKKHATFSTHYGSINNEFILPGEDKATRVPDGIAHFLEHKLFEQEDGSIMDKFSALGSSPNAYTSFNQTVYLFSCTDRFDENFKLLTSFVQNPYITEESVEKEKGIIGQEIMMYQDNPGWRTFFNLLGSFFANNPVRTDIAGTVESISKINRDKLYKCYNAFYHPSNMVILVVGDVEPQSVFEHVAASIKPVKPQGEIKRIFPEEKASINKKYTEQVLAVSMPQFQMGFRDNKLDTKGVENLKQEIAVKILLEMLMGRSSEFYNTLYNEGLLNSSFEYDYTIEENYAFSVFGGESSDPLAVRDRFSDVLNKVARNGLDKESYERIKKAMFGRTIRQFNSIERISHNFISVYFKGVNIFDYLGVYDKITIEYMKEIFDGHFNLDNLAVSVIKPS
jgi:Predicted Zn-dependent peptidases